MKVVDIFSGAGGLSYGFSQAGHNIILGIDKWYDAIQTFQENHNTVGLEWDISSIPPNKLPIKKNEVEVLLGGPPCKGFSIAGKRNKSDERNTLIKDFLDIVEYYTPEYVVIENVTGIETMELPGYNGSVPEYIHERFSEIGYGSDHKTLIATNYGVPQERKRVFFIAKRGSSQTVEFPHPTTPNRVQPVGEVLQQDFTEHPNHSFTNHSAEIIQHIQQLDYGESLYDYGESWKRLDPTKPSITIKENHGAPFVHPYEDRVGTPRECAAIQSFPNDYKFIGSKSSVLKQIGNAVPPKLAQEIGEVLKA